MILAIPEQEVGTFSGIGIPPYESVPTWWRWWCSVCRVSAQSHSASHAELALSRGDRHAAVAQCHTDGQLALFPPPAAEGAR